MAKYKVLTINIVLSVLLGIILFILLNGIDIINPTYDDWLIKNRHYDLSQGYIGWEFFRMSPFRFPLGIFDSLSYPFPTSIINTDSIPILAVFFKMLSPILPDKFQYYGIYGLSCYILNSLLGMLLIYKYSNKTTLGNISVVIAGGLFALVPSLTLKLYVHSALAAQWLILLSLFPIIYSEELSNKQKSIIYILSGIFAAGIHLYFIPITFIIFIADTIYSFVKQKNIQVFCNIFYFILAVITALYVFGFFNMNVQIMDGSEMFLRADSFKTSIETFFKQSPGFLYSENYPYIGIGFFVLIGVTVVSILYRIIEGKSIIKNKVKLIVLVLLAVFFILISLIPNISDILPDTVLKYISAIRFIPRFIWAANYVLIVLLLAYLFHNHSEKLTISVVTICMIIQYCTCYNINISKIFLEFRYRHSFTLNNNIWNEIAKNNSIKTVYFDKKIMHLKRVSTGTSISAASLTIDIGQWAYENNIKLNDFYFAKDIAYKEEILDKKLKDPLDEDIFIFLGNDAYNFIRKNTSLKYIYTVDRVVIARSIPIIGLENYKLRPFED